MKLKRFYYLLFIDKVSQVRILFLFTKKKMLFIYVVRTFILIISKCKNHER